MERLGLAMHSRHERELRQFAFSTADLVTLLVFVVLGANIPFDTLGEYFLPALAVLGALLFLARPVTVLACVLPDRRGAWTRPELAFLCWTRETGVVPAALVGVLAGLGRARHRRLRRRRRDGDRGHPAPPGPPGRLACGKARAPGRQAAKHGRRRPRRVLTRGRSRPTGLRLYDPLGVALGTTKEGAA